MPPIFVDLLFADGESAKDFIMGNEDVLGKLVTYMGHTQVSVV